jgi:sirohydrochlorin ferrochelatase
MTEVLRLIGVEKEFVATRCAEKLAKKSAEQRADRVLRAAAPIGASDANGEESRKRVLEEALEQLEHQKDALARAFSATFPGSN